SFTLEDDDVPEFETFWPAAVPGGERIGIVWHVVYSYALEGHAGDALLDRPAEIGARLELRTPSGPLTGTVVSRPPVPPPARQLGGARPGGALVRDAAPSSPLPIVGGPPHPARLRPSRLGECGVLGHQSCDVGPSQQGCSMRLRQPVRELLDAPDGGRVRV